MSAYLYIEIHLPPDVLCFLCIFHKSDTVCNLSSANPVSIDREDSSPLGKAVISRMNDKQIILLFQQRSEDAIRETARTYGGLLHLIAKNILGTAQDAEECVSDALLHVWNAIPPAEPAHFRAYLAAVTRNLALNRRAQLHAARRGSGETALVLEELLECIPSGDNVERVLDQIALREAVERFLHTLPARDARVFLRRYFTMMPVREIAADMNLNENTVKSILARTRAKLEQALKEEDLL